MEAVIAMIDLAPSHPRVVEIVSRVAPHRRGTVAMKLATRFDEPLAPSEADVYDAALCELVREEPVPVRAKVSERIARVPAGPVRCVLLFAHDREVAVAAPVLRESPLLPEPVLVALAWTRSQGHLSAIARRAGIGPRVSDMVLARGTAAVLRTLAANDTAALSEDGLARLARLSRGDPEIKAAVERRGDLTPELRRAMGAGPGGEGTDDPLSDEAIEAAADWLATLRAAREPREVDVARAFRHDEEARVVALVAHMARDELGEAATAFRQPALDAMLLILRTAEIGWPLAERIMRRRLGPGAAIGAQQGAYQGLSQRSAERALRTLRFRSRIRVVLGAREAASA